jgi:uncharacterized membrane protein
MNHTWYILVTFLHVCAALLWVGGMLFMSLVLIPALRAQRDPGLTARMIQAVGRIYRRWGWGTLIVLLLTGYAALRLRGFSNAILTSAAFWRAPFGRTLAWKLFFFVGVVAFSLIHDLSSAQQLQRDSEQPPSAEERSQRRKIASWLGRLTLILSLIIVFFGVLLSRGNPWMR